MGTPLPPNLPGNDCLICWGIGKEFGFAPTPRVVTMQLFSLQPGEFWNPDDEQLLLTPHLLEQAIAPCFWGIDDGIFDWQLQFFAFTTFIRVIRIADGFEVFRDPIGTACQLSINNGRGAPAGGVAFDGHCFISWDPEDLA